MNFEHVLLIFFSVLLCFDTKIKSRFFLLSFIMSLVLKFKNRKKISYYYLVLFFLLNFSIILLESKVLVIIYFIYIYYIYKFLFYVFCTMVTYRSENYLIIYLILILLINFNFLFVIFAIDFFVCLNNKNKEYDLLFMGFSEEFFKIILTARGSVKLFQYFESIIYTNSYFSEELRDNFYYSTNIDFFYKNYNDKYK